MDNRSCQVSARIKERQDSMMTGYTPTHIGIPKNHADFERKSVVLFRELLQDPGVKPLGRSGQKQFGIDLIG